MRNVGSTVAEVKLVEPANAGVKGLEEPVTQEACRTSGRQREHKNDNLDAQGSSNLTREEDLQKEKVIVKTRD